MPTIPQRIASAFPTLGRVTQDAGTNAGGLLTVLDEAARPKVKQARGV